MSKVLKIENGGYTIKVESGEQIILDTARGANSNGKPAGTVIVRGSLEVEGTTTTVESSDTIISDNIITLNYGEQGDGVSALKNYRSGIEIDRGVFAPARFIWDETLNWTLGPISGTGAFTSEDGSGQQVPLRINGITSTGNLYLDTGNSVISVLNTINYEEKIFNYSNGFITDPGTGVNLGDDNIPNTKSIVDYFDYALTNIGVSVVKDNDTRLTCLDDSSTGNQSKIEVKVNNNIVTTFWEDKVDFSELRIEDNKITTYSSNADIEIYAPGTGSVIINDVLTLKASPYPDDVMLDPLPPLEGVKIYSKPQSYGKTGIYYTNADETNDELISKNRSLLFSMLF